MSDKEPGLKMTVEFKLNRRQMQTVLLAISKIADKVASHERKFHKRQL